MVGAKAGADISHHCGFLDAATKLKGKSTRPGVYWCNACQKPYSVTVGTVFERSHVPLTKWLLALHLLTLSKKGISSHQLSRELGVTYKTSWFMAHRICESMSDPKPSPMGGCGKHVEIDETWVGHNSTKKKKAGGASHKYPVVSLVERGAKVRSIQADKVTKETVTHILRTNVKRSGTNLRTDKVPYYWAVGKEFWTYEMVDHSIGEYVRREDQAHTNTLEGFFSIFKRGVSGIYLHVSQQHLQRYLNEFDFRYNNRIRLGIDDAMRAENAIKSIRGKRLTYRRTDKAQVHQAEGWGVLALAQKGHRMIRYPSVISLGSAHMADRQRFTTTIMCWGCHQIGKIIWEKAAIGAAGSEPMRKLIVLSNGFHEEGKAASGRPKIVCDLCHAVQKD